MRVGWGEDALQGFVSSRRSHDADFTFACVVSECDCTLRLRYGYPHSVLEAEAGKRQEVICPTKVWVTQGLKPALWAHQHWAVLCGPRSPAGLAPAGLQRSVATVYLGP